MTALPAILFFFSGATALMYQVVWMRHAALHLGATTAAVGTVTATFLAGLALGSVAGGRWMDRALRTRPDGFALKTYGLLELAIGAYALLFEPLLSRLSPLLAGLYAATGEGGGLFLAARVLVCVALILPPTMAMGATLPILARHAAARAGDPARATGMLYAINTLGGVLGAAAAGWVLIPRAGLLATTLAAVGGNVAIALAALVAGRGGRAPEPAPAPEPSPAPPGWIFPAYAISGFAALACEIAWTRGLILSLGSSVYSFSLTLACFILGLGLGSLAGARLARKARDLVTIFALLQVATAVFVALTVTMLQELPMLMIEVVATGMSFNRMLAAQAALAGAVVLGPTLLLGAMFPVLCRLALGSAEGTGRAVGRLYSRNTTGNIFGALAAAFLLLPLQGVPGTLRIAAMIHVLVAAWAFHKRPAGWKGAPWATLAGGALLMALLPAWDLALVTVTPVLYGKQYAAQSADQNQPLEETLRRNSQIIYHQWDASGLVTVHRSGEALTLRINGKADASNQTDMITQTLTAHLPLLLHSDPKDVLVIGLGSGATAAAALRHPVRHVDCVEISRAVVGASKLFEPEVGPWSSDPRLSLFVTDARTHIRYTSQRYDVIAAEPSNLWLSGMATLFTREQFERYRELLRPGGWICQWVHAYRLPRADFAAVLATFQAVFPDCLLWEITIGGDYLLIGGLSGLPDFAAFRKAYDVPGVSEDLRRRKLASAEDLLRYWIGGPDMVRQIARGAREITDDFCHVEYSAPRGLLQDERVGTLSLLETVRGLPSEGLPGGPNLVPLREGRRKLATVVEMLRTRGAFAGLEALAKARAEAAGDPALPIVVESLANSVYARALYHLKNGEADEAWRCFTQVPHDSVLAPEARQRADVLAEMLKKSAAAPEKP